MASIYKRPGSKTWQCQYYLRDPNSGENTKIRRSTGKTNPEAARKAAAEMEMDARECMQSGSVEEQEAHLVLHKMKLEIRQRNFTFPSANKHFASLTSLVLGEKLVKHTLESWTEEWLRRKARGRPMQDKDPTVQRYRGHIKSFLDWHPSEGRKRSLETVTSAQVRKWKEMLEDSGLLGKTVKYYVKDLSMLFNAAALEGIVTLNPCTSIIPEINTEDSTSRKPFQMDEVKAMILAAPTREWKGLLLIAAFTGLRLSDAAKLPWSKVDIETGKISVIPAKTKRGKKEIMIPIQENLLEFLKAEFEMRESSEPAILPKLSKKNVEGASGLSNTFTDKVMAVAGVDRGKPSREHDKDESKGKGRITWERGFHSFRHTFNSWLRNAGVSEEDRMALTGHSTRESQQLYTHTAVETLRVAIGKLPSLDGKSKSRVTATTNSDSQEIAAVAAKFEEGTASERVERARELIAETKKQRMTPEHRRQWFEVDAIGDVFDPLMKTEKPAERVRLIESFLLHLEQLELEAEISDRISYNVRYGCAEPVPETSDEIIADRARNKLEDWQSNGVKNGEGIAEEFKRWKRSFRVRKEGIST